MPRKGGGREWHDIEKTGGGEQKKKEMPRAGKAHSLSEGSEFCGGVHEERGKVAEEN